MNFFKKFFKSKVKKEEELPKVGELWGLINSSPWATDYPPVTILDIKDGWVKYSMLTIFKDNRLKITTFLLIYKKVN